MNATVDDYYRSTVARAYYATYCRVTHELIAIGEKMPQQREGPTHHKLRGMVEFNLRHLPLALRLALSRMIGRLYTLRVSADYKPSAQIDARDAREAIAIMNKVFTAF